jgi:hypothetical protein
LPVLADADVIANGHPERTGDIDGRLSARNDLPAMPR